MGRTGGEGVKAAGSLCITDFKADMSFSVFEDAQQVSGVSTGHSGDAGGQGDSWPQASPMASSAPLSGIPAKSWQRGVFLAPPTPS